jgi:Fe-S-cluster containining protein
VAPNVLSSNVHSIKVPIAIAGPARSPGASSPLSRLEIEGLWVTAATRLGWRVQRTEQAYATSDGRGTISVGVADSLDPDDSVAQLVFHELCHGIVEGPAGWTRPDWSLRNDDDDPEQVVREHACLRVQIALCEQFGLRKLMAPTTVYRAYHDSIVGDPLVGPDPAAGLARAALERPESAPWLATVRAALAATLGLLQPGGPKVTASASTADLDAGPPRPEPLHPVGFAWGPADRTCGDCAWIHRGGRGRPVHRCRQSARGEEAGARTEPDLRACVRFEPPVVCQDCGACCREAYHSVTVAMRDPVVWKQPALIVRHGHRFEIRRENDRCAALEDRRHLPVVPSSGGGRGENPAEPGGRASDGRRPAFACSIYEDRPRPCREFEAGGRHCLTARRRVGASPGLADAARPRESTGSSAGSPESPSD